MINFGKIKTSILENLAMSYLKKDNKKIKNILGLITKNKDIKDLYLLYEDIENKNIEDEETAKKYVEELSSLLKDKNKDLEGIMDELENSIDDNIQINENEIYKILDLLSEEDNLLNLDKKILAKKNLTNHLLRKKEKQEDVNSPKIVNENMLFAVLSNNFNNTFQSSLSESEQKEFKEIMMIKEDELKIKVKDLKENIFFKIDSIISESGNNLELITKLNDVKKEVRGMKNSKHSYYKLKELKNGL
jgi:hypothetical protein